MYLEFLHRGTQKDFGLMKIIVCGIIYSMIDVLLDKWLTHFTAHIMRCCH